MYICSLGVGIGCSVRLLSTNSSVPESLTIISVVRRWYHCLASCMEYHRFLHHQRCPCGCPWLQYVFDCLYWRTPFNLHGSSQSTLPLVSVSVSSTPFRSSPPSCTLESPCMSAQSRISVDSAADHLPPHYSSVMYVNLYGNSATFQTLYLLQGQTTTSL